eukprot:sb/3476751/
MGTCACTACSIYRCTRRYKTIIIMPYPALDRQLPKSMNCFSNGRHPDFNFAHTMIGHRVNLQRGKTPYGSRKSVETVGITQILTGAIIIWVPCSLFTGARYQKSILRPTFFKRL